MIRMGIAGVGGSFRNHLIWYKGMADRVTIAAAAARNEENLVRICDAEGIQQRYTDAIEMIRHADIDALTIATPPVGRAEMIRAAAQRGLPVLCEKPLATTLEEAEEIGAILREHPVPLLMEFKMRQGENFQKIRDFLQQDDVGKPITILCRYALVNDPAIWNPQRWFWDVETSGGLLVENGGHMIDYLRWIAGEVSEVFAITEQKTLFARPEEYMRRSKTEDNAIVLMKHANGCTTMLMNTICYPGSRSASLEIATEGGYFIELTECTHLRIRKGDEVILDRPEEAYTVGDGFTTRHFVNDVILGGKKPYATYEDGIAALKIALAARRASEQGIWVKV